MSEASHSIDLITLCEELSRNGELETIGGAAYVSGLLDGVPDRPSIEHYIKIVRDKSLLRGLIHTATAAIARASEQSDAAEEILNDTEAQIFQLSEKRIGRGFMGVQEIINESFGSVDALLQRGSRITGLETHYVDLDEKTSGFQKSDLIIVAGRPSMGKTSFAMNIAENVAIEDRKDRGRVLARNVERGAAAAHAVLGGAGGRAQVPHRLSVAGRHAEDHAGDRAAGRGADFHRRHPGNYHQRNAGQGAAAIAIEGIAGPDRRGLSAAHVRRWQAL